MKALTLLNPRVTLTIVACLVMLCFADFGCVAQNKKIKNAIKSYGKASYQGEVPGAVMRDWLIAGPVVLTGSSAQPDKEAQLKFFNEDGEASVLIVPKKVFPPYQVGANSYPWQYHASGGDIINFDSLYQKDFSSAYALAEIISVSDQQVILGLGSDDGVKVWLNGKLIHSNWIPRGITPDEDLVTLGLVKGSNQILIKTQDIQQDWGFTARLLDKQALSNKLIAASGKGDLKEINFLLAAGADVNRVNSNGLSPIINAKIQGREEAVKLLAAKGAIATANVSAEILVDALYKSLHDKQGSGAAVLVAKDGKIIFKEAYGYADAMAKTKATLETKFRIGSVTKQFTASALLKLQEEGKLKLTDKLSQYFPDFPRGNEVTLHHLLSHTSGIHSYTAKADFGEKVVGAIKPEDLVTYFINEPFDFNPGEAFRYNNSGYFLAGLIIEKVSGKSYAQYLQDNFFAPLNMKNTGVHTASTNLTNEAVGHTKENRVYKKGLDWDMSWAGGAGNLYSTVEDLFLWNEAVFSGKVLSEKSLATATTAHKLNSGEPIADGKYGYGWGVDTFRGQQVISHSGGLHGFLSQLARYPQENLTVVILTNITPQEVELDPNKIAEYFLWEKLSPQRSYSGQAAANINVKQYEGRYDFQNGAVMAITAEGNNLFAQLSGQASFPIFPADDDEFFWKVVDARIKFIKNDAGDVTYGNFFQNGRELKVVKLEEDQIITVDPATHNRFIGKYNLGSSMIFTITVENGRIYFQATNQPRLELFPIAHKIYVTKEVKAKIIFEDDASGVVNKLILDMAGQKREAPKME